MIRCATGRFNHGDNHAASNAKAKNQTIEAVTAPKANQGRISGNSCPPKLP
ncbi:hypothetical protein YPPY98_1054, partial [Yersinia pestis PY-98]